jgi:hypothetical protein
MTDFKPTPGQMKVLKYLVEHEEKTGHRDGHSPGSIGVEIWGDGYRKPQAYARTAGKVLNTLSKNGLVITKLRLGYIAWYLTSTGERIYHLHAKTEGVKK